GVVDAHAALDPPAEMLLADEVKVDGLGVWGAPHGGRVLCLPIAPRETDAKHGGPTRPWITRQLVLMDDAGMVRRQGYYRVSRRAELVRPAARCCGVGPQGGRRSIHHEDFDHE